MREVPLEEAFWKYVSDRVDDLGIDVVATLLNQTPGSIRHYLNGNRRVSFEAVLTLMRNEGRCTATEILTRLHKAAGELEREEVKPPETVRATARGELRRRAAETGPTDEPEIEPPSSAGQPGASAQTPRAPRGRKTTPRRSGR